MQSCYDLPQIFVRTNCRDVTYCDLCKAPVVDDVLAREAHNMRLHPKLVNLEPLRMMPGYNHMTGSRL